MEYLIEGLEYEQLSQIHGGALICGSELVCITVGTDCYAYCKDMVGSSVTCTQVKIE